MTIFQRPFFNLNIKSFDLVTLGDFVTVFAESKSVTKSRLHCMYIKSGDNTDLKFRHWFYFLPDYISGL